MIIRSYMGVTGKQRKHMREIAETEQNQQDFTFIVGRKRGTEDESKFSSLYN